MALLSININASQFFKLHSTYSKPPPLKLVLKILGHKCLQCAKLCSLIMVYKCFMFCNLYLKNVFKNEKKKKIDRKNLDEFVEKKT